MRDAELVQRGRRADAREHQYLGRRDGPGAEDDFLALDGERLAAALHLGADGLLAVEQHAVDNDVGLDRQVQAVAGSAEEGQRRAHAHAVGVVHRDGADAARLRVVHVRVVGESGGTGGVVERLLRRQPGLAGKAAHRNEAVVVVEVVGPKVHVGFQLAQVGQDAGEAPLVVAQGGPGVVVLRHAAQQHLAVDGAGAAHHAPARDGHRLGRQRSRIALERPVVRRVNGRGCLVVAKLQVIGVGLELRVVRPRFQQQHRLFVGSSDSRLASVQPAEPAPRMM